MENNINQKIINANSVFDHGFLSGKSLYLYCFRQIPSASYINDIDGEKAFEAIKSTFGHLIKSVHGYRFYDNKKRRYVFDETFMVMQNGCVMEFDSSYCEIYRCSYHSYASNSSRCAKEVMTILYAILFVFTTNKGMRFFNRISLAAIFFKLFCTQVERINFCLGISG